MVSAVSAQLPSQDRALVLSARKGSDGARQQLGRQVGHAAFVFALQLTGDRDLAHDIAQDSALKFFRHLDRFDVDRPIEPWLYQIVRNQVRDHSRRQGVRRGESLDRLLEQGRPEPAGVIGDPVREVERAELQQRIWRGVSALSDDHREIFLLRDYHDLSYSEIAEVLSIPVGTVMSRLHTARVKMRAHLSGEGNSQ